MGSLRACFKERKWVRANQSAAPILCCEAEINAGTETADYILVTPFFVPVSCRIIKGVLLDQPTCYLASLSCSSRTTVLFHASGSFCGFNYIMTHMYVTCAHAEAKVDHSNSVTMASVMGKLEDYIPC